MAEVGLRELIRKALKARTQAYVPYSHFQVGAALETKEGKVYQGCNIENVSYGVTNCAERTAFFKAVSEGARDFSRIVVVGGKEGAEELEECPPCGVCRQVMAEFCDVDSFQVVLARSEEDYHIYMLRELLPHAFLPANLEK